MVRMMNGTWVTLCSLAVPSFAVSVFSFLMYWCASCWNLDHGVGVPVCWCAVVGVLVCWCVGVLVCWCAGVGALIFFGVDVLVCCCVAVLVCKCVGMLVY